jgi:hypothetical protein
VSRRQLKKRIESLESQLKMHQEKIAEEQNKPVPDEGLISHWQREIEIFKLNIEKAHKRLRKNK